MADNDVKIVLSLGSNCEQERNVAYAMGRLRELFPGMSFSRTIRTKPIGIESDMFANALGMGICHEPLPQVVEELKAIERECGRREEEKARNIVRLDLDLLLYGSQRCHEKDWERPYIKQLWEEMASPFITAE